MELSLPTFKLTFSLNNSWAIFKIFEFLEQNQNIKMQALNRKFYYVFCPQLQRFTKLFTLGSMSCGVIVFPG